VPTALVTSSSSGEVAGDVAGAGAGGGAGATAPTGPEDVAVSRRWTAPAGGGEAGSDAGAGATATPVAGATAGAGAGTAATGGGCGAGLVTHPVAQAAGTLAAVGRCGDTLSVRTSAVMHAAIATRATPTIVRLSRSIPSPPPLIRRRR
jgi:hypothetical protein